MREMFRTGCVCFTSLLRLTMSHVDQKSNLALILSPKILLLLWASLSLSLSSLFPDLFSLSLSVRVGFRSSPGGTFETQLTPGDNNGDPLILCPFTHEVEANEKMLLNLNVLEIHQATFVSHHRHRHVKVCLDSIFVQPIMNFDPISSEIHL